MKLQIIKYSYDNEGELISEYKPKTYTEKIEALNKVIFILTGDYKDKWIATFEYIGGKYWKIVKDKTNRNKWMICGEWC